MNRQEFIKAATMALAGSIGLHAEAKEDEPAPKGENTFPALCGREFQGLEGAIAPLFTPYKKDGAINSEMVGRMVEFLLGKGISGFYIGGGTGEHVLLSIDERKYLAEAAIKAVAGRAKVVVHVGCTRTDDAVQLARHAEKAGADWIASLGPLVFGQNFDATLYHYGRIAGATALPVMIYCWYRELDPERELRLFEIPNIKGLKYTGHNFCAVQELKRRLGKEAAFFVGDDPHLLSGLAMHKVFSGGIGTTYNIIPQCYANICKLAKSGRFAEASVLQEYANGITRLVTQSANFSYRKAAMRVLGFDCGFARSPFGWPVSDNEYGAFARRLENKLQT